MTKFNIMPVQFSNNMYGWVWREGTSEIEQSPRCWPTLAEAVADTFDERERRRVLGVIGVITIGIYHPFRSPLSWHKRRVFKGDVKYQHNTKFGFSIV